MPTTMQNVFSVAAASGETEMLNLVASCGAALLQSELLTLVDSNGAPTENIGILQGPGPLWQFFFVHQGTGAMLEFSAAAVAGGTHCNICLAALNKEGAPRPLSFTIPLTDMSRPEFAAELEGELKRAVELLLGVGEAPATSSGGQERRTGATAADFASAVPQRGALPIQSGRVPGYGEQDIAPGGVTGQRPGFTRGGPTGGMLAGPGSVLFTQPSGVPGTLAGRWLPTHPGPLPGQPGFPGEPEPDHEPMPGRPNPMGPRTHMGSIQPRGRFQYF